MRTRPQDVVLCNLRFIHQIKFVMRKLYQVSSHCHFFGSCLQETLWKFSASFSLSAESISSILMLTWNEAVRSAITSAKDPNASATINLIPLRQHAVSIALISSAQLAMPQLHLSATRVILKRNMCITYVKVFMCHLSSGFFFPFILLLLNVCIGLSLHLNTAAQIILIISLGEKIAIAFHSQGKRKDQINQI